MLYELKTYQAPTIEAKWLQQLLGYLLLDYNDQLGIQGLAVYMVRYGQRFQWTVQEVLSALSGQVPPPNLAELRAEFREAARGETSQIEAAVAAQRAASWAEFQARRAATEVKPKPKRSRATKSK